MIDVEKRKKWNYKQKSSEQFEKYVGKMNAVHQTPTEQYPGQFPYSGVITPKTPQEAKRMLEQQQKYQRMGMAAPSLLPPGVYAPQPTGLIHPQAGYTVPYVPPTPTGFLSAGAYYNRKLPF